ncbi:MAG: HAMP domain-containing histidine kinase [Moraxellaceae bacterium]|nr:MAG: HAMP domain-containing histidine kinase [Moraxellaceae bacterium]
MTTSISQRVFRVVLLSTFCTLVSMLALAWWQVEALEEAIIESFTTAEVEYFAQYGDKNRTHWNESSQVINVYIPFAEADVKKPPVLFENITAPFRGEIERLDGVYAVDIHQFPEGTLYYAQDLELFERTESIALGLLIAAAIVAILLSYFSALLAVRYISTPVHKLVDSIQKIQHLHSAEPINATQFQELELQSICAAINQFLHQRQEAAAREKSWLAMASHEFRTPLSIMSGAVSVLQKRGNLSADDDKTLTRIADACNAMTSNVNTLLAIARRKPLDTPQKIDISALIDKLMQEYALRNPQWPARIKCQINSNQQPFGEIGAIKIALDNLLINALTYTAGDVNLILNDRQLIVADQGASLAVTSENQGLGLYIVTKACEYVHWRFEVELTAEGRKSILWFNSADTLT